MVAAPLGVTDRLTERLEGVRAAISPDLGRFAAPPIASRELALVRSRNPDLTDAHMERMKKAAELSHEFRRRIWEEI